MSQPRFLTEGEYTRRTLFISYEISLHSEIGVVPFSIGEGVTGGSGVTNFRSTDNELILTSFRGGLSQTSDQDFIIDQWHTVNMVLSVIGLKGLLVGASLDGSFLPTDTQVVDESYAEVLLQSALVGIINPQGTTDLHIRRITIGTSSIGSSEILYFNSSDHLLTQSVIPPFDSITGDGVTIDSDGLRFQSDGSEVFAVKLVDFP